MNGLYEPVALATGLADAPASHFTEKFVNLYIPLCGLAGLLFALYQVALVSGIRVHSTLLDDDTEALLGPAGDHDGARSCCRLRVLRVRSRALAEIAKSAAHIHGAIKEGAQSFLKTEYRAILSFCIPVRASVVCPLGVRRLMACPRAVRGLHLSPARLGRRLLLEVGG